MPPTLKQYFVNRVCSSANAPKEIAPSQTGTKLTFGRDPNLNKEDYMVKNQEGTVVVRSPGYATHPLGAAACLKQPITAFSELSMDSSSLWLTAKIA